MNTQTKLFVFNNTLLYNSYAPRFLSTPRITLSFDLKWDWLIIINIKAIKYIHKTSYSLHICTGTF